MTVDERYQRLEDTVRAYNPTANFDKIRAAYEFAAAAHQGEWGHANQAHSAISSQCSATSQRCHCALPTCMSTSCRCRRTHSRARPVVP